MMILSKIDVYIFFDDLDDEDREYWNELINKDVYK